MPTCKAQVHDSTVFCDGIMCYLLLVLLPTLKKNGSSTCNNSRTLFGAI